MNVTLKIDPLPHEQLSPNKVGRTDFTPGQIGGKPNDMEWPKHFPIPTGNPIIDAYQNTHNMKFTEVYDLNAGIINDPILPDPVILGTLTSTESEPTTQEHWGANADHPLSGKHVWKNTKTLEDNGSDEQSIGGYTYEP